MSTPERPPNPPRPPALSRATLLLAGLALLGGTAVMAILVFWLLRAGPAAAAPAPLPALAMTATRTPFQPAQATTQSPSATPLPTQTPTSSPSPSPAPSATPLPTETPPPPPPPAPPPPAEPPAPPDSAAVQGVSGVNQSMPLSCEARSAVDWARFFGVSIGESEFQDALPVTDNPETGFVGSPYGTAGFVPPRSYGAHAAPVARLLRAYGLKADDSKGVAWEDVQREIAAGRPVIVWVIGSVQPGSSVAYTPPDGETTRVAPFEHTVMVIGYSPDSVTVQDGGMVYSTSLARFLNSWAVLGNMAILAH